MSDWDNFSGYGNDDEDYTDYDLNDVLFSNSPDNNALELLWDAVKAGSHAEETRAWSELGDYLYDYYGLQLDELWDWEDFRAWYESQ